MLKKVLFGLSLAGMLWGCDVKEKENLRAEVDSLRIELKTSQQMAQTLEEVGTLIDSIDANRNLLRTDVLEGTSYSDYSSRLKEINNHISATQAKIDELEKSLESSKSSVAGYAATIKRLKSDLSDRSNQVAALEGEIEKMRGENQTLAQTVTMKDSVLTQKEEMIQMTQQDLASLEQHVDEVNEKAKNDQADLYFAQAEALEVAADRTKFAPKKKKETQREALELYRMSFALGKDEAQQKIETLEKALS